MDFRRWIGHYVGWLRFDSATVIPDDFFAMVLFLLDVGIGRIGDGLYAADRSEFSLVHGRLAMHSFLVLELFFEGLDVGIVIIDAIRYVDVGLATNSTTVHSRKHISWLRYRLPILSLLCCISFIVPVFAGKMESSPSPKGGG